MEDLLRPAAHGSDLEGIAEPRQGHDSPKGGFIEGTFAVTHGLIQVGVVVEVGGPCDERANQMARERAHGRCEGSQGEADVAAFQGVPLVTWQQVYFLT